MGCHVRAAGRETEERRGGSRDVAGPRLKAMDVKSSASLEVRRCCLIYERHGNDEIKIDLLRCPYSGLSQCELLVFSCGITVSRGLRRYSSPYGPWWGYLRQALSGGACVAATPFPVALVKRWS